MQVSRANYQNKQSYGAVCIPLEVVEKAKWSKITSNMQANGLVNTKGTNAVDGDVFLVSGFKNKAKEYLFCARVKLFQRGVKIVENKRADKWEKDFSNNLPFSD